MSGLSPFRLPRERKQRVNQHVVDELPEVPTKITIHLLKNAPTNTPAENAPIGTMMNITMQTLNSSGVMQLLRRFRRDGWRRYKGTQALHRGIQMHRANPRLGTTR